MSTLAEPEGFFVGDHVTYQHTDHLVLGLVPAGRDRDQVGVLLRRESDHAVGTILMRELHEDLTRAELDLLPSPFASANAAELPVHDSERVDPELRWLGESHTAGHWDQPASETTPGGKDDLRAPSLDPSREVDRAAFIAALPEKVRAAAVRKEAHALDVIFGSYDQVNEGGELIYPHDAPITTRVRTKAIELGCCQKTVWNIARDWKEDQLWGMVDKRYTRAVEPINLHPQIISLVLEQIAAEGSQSTGSQTRFYQRLVQRQKNRVPEAERVPIGSQTSVMRQVKLLADGQHLFGNATSRLSLSLKPKGLFHATQAARPGRIHIDSTKLDVLAYDPIQDVNIRVVLMMAIDVCTRSIVAWKILPEAENQNDACLLLLQMLRPTAMRPNWPEWAAFHSLGLNTHEFIDHDRLYKNAAAQPVICPTTFVIDHGRVYVSRAFTRACQALGINIQNARVRTPTDKPMIERAFGTIRLKFSQYVAGYTGRNTSERGTDTDLQARWTIEELEEFLTEFIVVIYQNLLHEGLASALDPTCLLSPNKKYVEDVICYGWIPAPQRATLYYELMPSKQIKVQDYGVNCNSRTYNHPLLQEYAHRKSPYPDGKWPIHFDTTDCRYVYFWAIDEQKWIALRWTHAPDLLQPFTENQFRMLRARRRNQGQDPRNQEAVAAALLDLQNRTDAPENAKATTKRRKAADARRIREGIRDRALAAEATDETVAQLPVRDEVGAVAAWTPETDDGPLEMAEASATAYLDPGW